MRHPRPKAPGGTENIFNIEPNMTKEELSTLTALPVSERVGACWKLRSKELMTKAEYEQVIAYRPEKLDPEPRKFGEDETAAWISGEFGGTTHTDRAAGTSQKARLLALLREGRWFSTREINERVYGAEHLNQSRIAARVNDLRNDGWDVSGSDGPGGTYGYRLNANEKIL